MGNLLGGVSFREPTTVEDCDSTWQTDSEPEPEPEPEPEEPGPGGGSAGPRHEPEQPAQSPEPAEGRPGAGSAPDEDAEAAGAEQIQGSESYSSPSSVFQYPRKGTADTVDPHPTLPINLSQHNYLRITRILKSLGELGYESFKSPLVKFILHEALVENTIPNIKQSALEYFVYTIRDRRERRNLLRFAQKHYTPSENFIWGPPRKEQSEGSKAQKMPAPLASSHSSQTSMHKKSKDSKNSSSAVHLNSKTAEEKKVAPKEPGEETGRPDQEPSNDDAKLRNTEKDSDAENVNSQPEKTVTDPTEKKESVSASEKDEESESPNRDCEDPGNTSCHDVILLQ
ncbi:PREDICTED: opioid growth factor receptor-like protein 1 [Propithecus coquereli]|uniref:opioid growth factor receptor-like protein 1 n=1 Tax=Propithecus coquereli TaxID=379532 RepID=UPI00063F17D8|nr:PREDICTED: opioid growth factor receptor-like protein 1 [Propithecus coquereli]